VLLGVVAFRGEILPCCSLARVLDLPVAGEQSTSASRTLILEESAGRRWAIPIDGVLGVRADVSDDPDLLAPIGLPIASQWVKTSVIEDSGTFYLLDAEVLFRQIALATA
jgi:chemotaxis signal transduction protein